MMRKRIVDFYNKYSVIFNIISFLVGIGGICLTIWISKQPVTLPQKELSCMTSSSKSLVLMLNNDSNLKLIYGEREVSNPCITSIVIQNTGAYPVTNEDFLQPLSIVFDKNDDILAINIGECSSSYIREEVIKNSKFSDQKLTIDSFFLNQGEMFTVDIISDGGIPLIKFDKRLKGINDLNLIDIKPDQALPSTVVSMALPLICMMTLGLISIAIALILVISVLKQTKQDRELYKRLETEFTQKMCEENESNEPN